MRVRTLLPWTVAVTLATGAGALAGDHPPAGGGGIEPGAGQWKTWVISSGRDYRVPPPPHRGRSAHEVKRIEAMLADPDEATRARIAYWDAGDPAYRWVNLVLERALNGVPTTAYPHRVLTYVTQAAHDATIATWESKAFHGRSRPSLLNPRLRPLVDVPDSPSYPAEHAAVAQAAAAVLAHFLPAEAASFQAMAEQAGWSRVEAGVQYPSDYQAGLALGRRVAEQVIAKADGDGSSVPWQGTVPVGPCYWQGAVPGNAAVASWTPILLSSPSEFRPPPPPPCDSPEVTAQATLVRTFPRTFVTNYKAFYWQSPEGLNSWPYRYLEQWLFEDRLDRNPPRAARAYALLAGAFYDAFIASNDGKIAYFYIRPHQLDPGIVPLFPVPPFPSYPSNHSTLSAARAEVLAYLFPAHADFVRAVGKEAGDSRIWAGIHYPMDNESGVALGKKVAERFVAWGESDRSQ
jgi:membrane-associated phospholipid phosphatase